MNAREYYSQIETTINDCPIVTHFSTEFDEIDQFVGYLKGKLDFSRCKYSRHFKSKDVHRPQ